MAASDWRAGYELSVEIGGETYGFRTTGYHPTANRIDRSNSKYDPGFIITKPGARQLEFTAEGPYREGEAPLTIGGEYTFTYRPYATHVGFTFLAAIVDLSHTNDVNDGPNLSITAVNTSEFEVDFS